MTKKSIEVFPSLIYQSRIFVKNLARDLKAEVLVQIKEDERGQLWSKQNYRHGYTSYGSRDRLFDYSPTFSTLGAELDKHVSLYFKDLQYEPIQRKRVALNSMWVNVMGKGSYHTSHIHPHSVISGTFYLQVPSGSGKIKFEDPRMGLFMNSPEPHLKAQNSRQRFFLIEPKPLDVVLFESWMKHEVLENQCTKKLNGERISISFNYDWISETCP